MPSRTGRLAISQDLLLLVEGRDEFHLFEQLIQSCFSHTPGIQVLDIGGKTTLAKNLKAMRSLALSRPSLRSIGIVRDADTGAADSFRSVQDSVQRAGYTPPSAHATFSNASPSIGVFIAPDGKGRGAIEALCRNSVRGNEAAGCVDDFIDCLNTRNALRSNSPDKTFTHAYLAASRNPVARVGEGALQGVWNFQSPAFTDLREFIHELASR